MDFDMDQDMDMDPGPPSRKRGGGALTTFILVLIILLLSGVFIYLRYGDLILNRLYQFSDGKIGADTGVTLPARTRSDDDAEPVTDDAEPVQDDGGASDDAEPVPDDAEPVTDDAEPVPGDAEPLPDDGGASEYVAPPELDFAAASALPDGLTLSASDFTIRTLGESVTVRVTAGSDGPFQWISEKPSVAPVDASGKITAAAHGTVKIIVTDGVRKGVCIARMITGATTTEAKLNTVDFTRTIEEGDYQLKVTGVETQITWTTDNESVAVVDAYGIVTPVGKGRAQIRASWDGGYLICVVRVPG